MGIIHGGKLCRLSHITFSPVARISGSVIEQGQRTSGWTARVSAAPHPKTKLDTKVWRYPANTLVAWRMLPGSLLEGPPHSANGTSKPPRTKISQLAGLRLNLLHINLRLAVHHTPPPLQEGKQAAMEQRW